MAKRSSEVVSLERIKQIGKVSYNRKDLLGDGSFGTVFKGKFKESEDMPEIEVAIKRIQQINLLKNIETVVMAGIELHPNVLKYYCIEEDDDFV